MLAYKHEHMRARHRARGLPCCLAVTCSPAKLPPVSAFVAALERSGKSKSSYLLEAFVDGSLDNAELPPVFPAVPVRFH